jgi:hypothetical protein
LNGQTYNASPPLLILLELIFEYLKIVKRMRLLAGDLTEAIFGCIRLFAVGASKNLLEGRRPVGLRSLVLSGSSLYFYFQLVPFIKSELEGTDAPRDLVDKGSSAATEELKRSCHIVLARIENMQSSAAKAESHKN